ncbi:hypothetical protein OG234_19360 [Streptomyces sp. NBC_01420]|uniref:hypothetical protein n=1 Tax=Streptomyces sp. NBC_01420 TaxID=2903858 RepID=UPI00324D198D
MTYNLLTVDAVSPHVMAVALAGCLGVDLGDVEVADPDGDPDGRNWDAPVSCEYRAVSGDFSWSLDIYVQDDVPDPPRESEIALGFSSAATTTVLFPAEEDIPSAYWAATPEGLLTRVRLELSDDDPPLLEVTAVEAPVPQLPQAVVTRFEEIVREQKPETPVAGALAAAVERVRQAASPLGRLALDDSTGSPLWAAQDYLVVWERLVRQLESSWAPSGWYPAGLYKERLEARDKLAGIGVRLPREVAGLLDKALEELDSRFVAATQEDPLGNLRRELTGAPANGVSLGPWWLRRPEPAPWDDQA